MGEMDITDFVEEDADLTLAFPYVVAFDGDDEEDEDDDDSGDDGDDADDDDSDESEEDDDDDAPTPADWKKQRSKLRAEAKRHRIAARKAREELAAKNAGSDDKDEKETSEKLTKAEERAERAEAVATARAIQIALRDGLVEYKLDPRKAKAIEKLIDADDIDVDDDGSVSGLDEELERIAEEYPEWVVKSKAKSDEDEDEDDDDDSDEEDEPKRKRKPSGRSVTSKTKSKKDLNRSSLEKKYPALIGR
jgi:hypothetical protein